MCPLCTRSILDWEEQPAESAFRRSRSGSLVETDGAGTIDQNFLADLITFGMGATVGDVGMGPGGAIDELFDDVFDSGDEDARTLRGVTLSNRGGGGAAAGEYLDVVATAVGQLDHSAHEHEQTQAEAEDLSNPYPESETESIAESTYVTSESETESESESEAALGATAETMI